jgi:hypothetical protein
MLEQYDLHDYQVFREGDFFYFREGDFFILFA